MYVLYYTGQLKKQFKNIILSTDLSLSSLSLPLSLSLSLSLMIKPQDLFQPTTLQHRYLY